MRIGLFADVHGNLPCLEAVWKALSSAGADIFAFAGDAVQYGPFPAECIEFLRDHSVECVQGNCDRAVARGRNDPGDEFVNLHWRKMAVEALAWTRTALSAGHLAWLRALPEEIRYEAGTQRVLITHGLPGNISGSLPGDAAGEVFDMILARSSCSLLMVGHTHENAFHERRGGWIVNPGSVGGGTLPAAGTASIVEIPDRGGPLFSSIRAPFDPSAHKAACRAAGLPDIYGRCAELGRDPRGLKHAFDTGWRQRWTEV